jgi:hypothetical protein
MNLFMSLFDVCVSGNAENYISWEINAPILVTCKL